LSTASIRTLRELLDAAAARGDAPAVIACEPGAMREISGAGLARDADALAAQLLREGVRHGEPVVLLGPNSVEWIVSYFGILSAGALPVPIDYQTGARDLAHIIADCGAKRVFTTAQHVALLRSADGKDLRITRLDEPASWRSPRSGVERSELPGLLPALHPDDNASLLYTSGTTGAPKGVPLTHGNFTANIAALVATRLAGPGDRLLVPLPLHHAYPFTCGLLACLATGAALVLPAGVSGPQLVSAIRDARVTVLLGVPRLYTALLDGIRAKATASPLAAFAFPRLLALSTAVTRATGWRIGRRLFASLHREMGATLQILGSGGAPLDPEVAWQLEGLGWEVLTGYGLTETAPILTFNIRGQVLHGAAGRPVPGVEIRIDAPSGQASGEILARGPNVFAGYLNNAEATQAAFTPDGWFRTGDIGSMDQNGFLHITGRVKEMIVLPDGKKVFPEAVESAFAAIPLIREMAVLEHGGRLVALVVPDEAEIRRHGAARIDSSMREYIETVSLGLAPYQRISDYRLSHASLPRTPLGKLQRFRLPAIYAGGRVAAAATPAEISAADQALLASDLGQRLWSWLGARFADKPLSLDASPQLDLQVDSLEWLTITLEIRDRFAVNLGQDAVARVLTVRDLVTEVLAAAARPAASGEVISAAQARWLEPPGAVARIAGSVLYTLNRLVMRLLFRLEVKGIERVPSVGPLVIAPNHASYLDPMAVAAALPRRLLGTVFWAGWTGFMFRNGFWRALSRATQVFPVDPDRGPATAIASGEAVLARGQMLIWFAEGRRTLTGETGPFLPGIGVVLQRSGAYALPVRVDGSYQCLPWNRRWPRPGRITVTFGPPLTVAELEASGEGATPAERIAAGLRRAVLSLVEATPARR
jgi:long-chain acyl-CoA synthetase